MRITCQGWLIGIFVPLPLLLASLILVAFGSSDRWGREGQRWALGSSIFRRSVGDCPVCWRGEVVPNPFLASTWLPEWKTGSMNSSNIFVSTIFRFSNVSLIYFLTFHISLLFVFPFLLSLLRVFCSTPLPLRGISIIYLRRRKILLLAGCIRRGRPRLT